MHISITGNLGSGKSTIGRILSNKYGFEIYSTGKIQRELAAQMNMSTLELNQLMLSNPSYDNMIDNETVRISRDMKDKDIIFDSRLAWNFAEKSFKVFVSVSLEIAAERIMNDERGAVEKYSSLDEAINNLAERANTENKRYKEIYNLNYMDFTNYDLVIDSTYCLPDKIAEVIYHEARINEVNPYKSTKMLVSPKRLIFKEPSKEYDKEKLNSLISKYKELPYYVEDTVKIIKKDFDYVIEEGEEYARAALLADAAFICIEVI